MTRMRTISTSALSRTMSNKAVFGRDVSEFLCSLGATSQNNECGSGIRITAIVPHSDGCFNLRIDISGGGEVEKHEFVLLGELVSRLEIAQGEIECELMPEIEYCAEVTRAYFSACSSFAFAPSSLKGLERKLSQKGFETDVAKEAVEFISSRNLVDEADIAHRRAELMVKKLWGRSRIVPKLREEGFSDDTLKSLGEYLHSVDFERNCATLIEKKFAAVPEDRAERDKMIASLSRYGYSLSEIKKAILMCKN